MGEAVIRRVFAVRYSQLDRWNVAYFRSVNWKWPKEYIRPIGTALSHIQKLITTDLVDTPIIEKISFGGELTVLGEEDRAGYKGRLFKAESGQLIYSKIRVKQGSVCIVPPSIDWVAVSSEYPVYEIDPTVADPKYLELVLRSNVFKHYLDGLSHGGSTKTRIHSDQFEDLSIPIPPLLIQQKIVTHWEVAQTQANDLLAQADKLLDELERQVLGELGLNKKKRMVMPKVMVANWAGLTKWNQRATFLLGQTPDLRKGNYPVVSGRECMAEVKHGCSASPSGKPTTLKVLKLSAVTSGRFLPTEAKFITDKKSFRENFDLIKGDILLCRTNGTLAYVGRPAILEKDYPELIFPDKLMRVRCKANVLPEYLEYILSTSIARPQLEANARTAVGNHAIGNEDVFNVELPIPPISEQEKVVKQVKERTCQRRGFESEKDY
jgi:type I restriction enzyme, S subunit